MSNPPSDVPDLPPATEIRRGSRRSGGEVQVSVDLLLRARHQVMKSVDLDPPSKKILDDLMNTVIQPLDLGVAVEKNRFLQYKYKIISDEMKLTEIGPGIQDLREKVKIVTEISLSDFSPAREIGSGSQDPREKLVDAASTTDTEVIQAARTLLDIKSSSTEEEIFPTPDEEEVADIFQLLKSGEHSWSKEEVSLLMEEGLCEDGPDWNTIQNLFFPNRSIKECIDKFIQQKDEANQASRTKGQGAAYEE